jgi:hypothetical protein
MFSPAVLVRIQLRHGFLAVVVAAILATTPIRASQTATTTAFAERVAALSETPGYFDTDNLISNEREYLSVLPDLARRQIKGGAYIGVGPDQNFSYIAAVRPSIAILVDIRRDNLLLHLLFKALFDQSRTRVDYLALLTGRAVPPDPTVWRTRTIGDIVGYIERQRPRDATAMQALYSRLTTVIRGFGVPLSAADLATIHRFHGRFIEDGLDLQFQSTGRPPQAGYPTFRDLTGGRRTISRQKRPFSSSSLSRRETC